MKVYLSGPMTGIPDYNRPAFAKAAQDLRELGVEVVSPHELNQDLGEGAEWEAYMRGDIKEMMDCTSLALLPGWESSRGAHIELSLAHKLGMGVMLLEDVLPKAKGPRVEELLKTAETQCDALAAQLQEMREALEGATEFVDSHSEPWYNSGQRLLKECGKALATPDTSIQTLARRDAAIWMEAAEVCQNNCKSIGNGNAAWNSAVDDCVAELRAKADELLKGLGEGHDN